MLPRSLRYELLAGLLDYPEKDGYADTLELCIERLEEGYEQAAALLRPLRDQVRGMTREQVQEMYTRTFDINAVCTLEIGWHIYGEDYARGALLVKLREQLRLMNIPESTELPDHLTHVLILLGRLSGSQADDLAARYLLPGLDKMLVGVSEGEYAYTALLEAISKVVRTDHDVEVVTPREKRGAPPDSKNTLPVFGKQGCAKR